MFRHGKSRILAVAAVAVMSAVISVTVLGSSPSPVTVKLTPSLVSVDTSALAPKLAQAEMDAVWHLFDRDTDAAYIPMETARVTVNLPQSSALSQVRVYGASSYQLNLYRDNNGAWEPVPSLTGVDLTVLGAAWNRLNITEPFSTSQLLFEFVPQGNVTAGLREVEIWGPEAASGDKSWEYVTLEGIRTPQDMVNILARPASHILEFSAAPSELSVPEGGTSAVAIGLIQNPALFKRAYILYDGYNLVSSVSIQRRINSLSWTGGFAISQPADTVPSWSSYLEEINPAWLVQGENRIEFRTASGTATIRGLRLIVETDSGWNLVSAVSAAAVYDGDTSTAYTIAASATDPSIQLSFERTVQPDILKLHSAGPMNLTAGLQYLNGATWQDVKAGWQLNLSTLKAGWNDITIPGKVTTQALRLVFNTASLKIKPGVGLGAINEVRVSAAPVGPVPATPRIVISYPRNGEYFGRTAYIQGFATPAVDTAGNSARCSVEGKDGQRTVPDGSFSLSLTKDETHFYDQADNDPWQPVAQSTYDGQIGAMQNIVLNKNSGVQTDPDPNGESRKNAPFTDNRDHHTEKVSPGQAKKIQYGGVTLDIPQGAVDQDTDITIVPLNETDLAHYDPGMINVTYPAAGYRFLPHGMKFKKPINISFGYAKQLFVAGQTDNDVNMYYYDETLLRWQQLNRVKADPATSQVTALSDHFTDIINSTLVVPEHPQALSFNPNSIKDIKAADPTANVNLIEPPQANSRGTANLSYPIEVPQGRNKLQPNLAVQYNSSGGNGWMGMGWDLPMQAITVDTRWGVPRYSSSKETETYTIDGEQLSPAAHRGPFVDRVLAQRIFHTRVEGQFRKIIRHGSSPSSYWWEVIDKNGTRYLYGGTNGPTTDATLRDENENIFMWTLREVRDTNNNFIRYYYAHVKDPGFPGGLPGENLYLQGITYTGNGTKEGPYTVTFTRDQTRIDKQSDARGGFKRVTGDLLTKIEIYLGGTYQDGEVKGGNFIRSYEFDYNHNAYGDGSEGTAFYKTLLTSISQYGAKHGLFNKHEFTYYDDARKLDGTYKGFASTGWDARGSGTITAGGIPGTWGAASALGGDTSNGGGGHFHLGLGIDTDTSTKNVTIGFKIGFNQTEGDALVAMVDIDGDGLPDKVYNNGGYFYQKNMSGPHGPGAKFGPPVSIGIPGISHQSVTSTTWGAELYIYVPMMYDQNRAETENDTYLMDVNGDGLIDVVKGGMVYFNHIVNEVPVFEWNSVATPVPIGKSVIDTNGLLPDRSAEEAEREEKFPLLDTVRRWVAPYDGTVKIDAPVTLIKDPKKKPDYKDDGVQVAIQLEGAELWSTQTISVEPTDPRSARILANDYDTVHTPVGVDSVPVHRGDRLYFRVQSVYNGLYDQVSWDPIITYLAGDTARTDANGLTEYVYQASKEFTLAGRRGKLTMPITGTVHLGGELKKTKTTSDDVSISITQNGTEVYRNTVPWDETGTFNVSQDISVKQKDELVWRVLADSQVDAQFDASNVTFKPSMYYSAADGYDTVTDNDGKPFISIDPPYEMDLYPVNTLTAPQEFLVTAATGTLIAVPSLEINSSIAVPREVAFTAKRTGALLGKGIITITRDVDGNLVVSAPTLTFTVDQGDKLFFDFSTRDLTLAAQVISSSVAVHDEKGNFIDAPSAFHSAAAEDVFPVPFRGWGVVGYNGNKPRDTQPIDQSLLVLNDSYDVNNARVYPFRPVPVDEAWGGIDKSAWIKKGVVSSSRLGLKEIPLLHSDKFSSSTAPSRISKSTNDSGSLIVSASKGQSESLVDFQDMNGDAYPDVIGGGGVQYTAPTGELNGGASGGLGSARLSRNESFNVSTDAAGNIATSIANGKGNVAASGQASAGGGSQGTDMPRIGMSANKGNGTSDTEYDLIDVNGDGLPDKVFKGGTVMLNLGYQFKGDRGGVGAVNSGSTDNGGVSMGFQTDWYSMGGGMNVGLDNTVSSETYADINGDGLPDKLSPGLVMLNTGSGYKAITWPGLGEVARDEHVSYGGGVYFTFGFTIYDIIKITFNIGVNMTNNIGRPEVAFRDIDGDGYVDQLTSTSAEQLSVGRNQIGRTNILKTVKRPLGGSIAIEYTRDGNTYDMPQSQWTLTKSTLTDGRKNTYETEFAYKNGYKDRFERDFYGFETVIEKHAPGKFDVYNKSIERWIVQTFNNRDFYLKGLLLDSRTTDKNMTHIWARTVNEYTLMPVAGFDYTQFPALSRTDTYFYDGNDSSSAKEDGFKKSTYQRFDYDLFGNVSKFWDFGEFYPTNDITDDMRADIDYYNDPIKYIIKPREIKVYGTANNRSLRWRTSGYDAAGNMTSLTLHNTGTPASVSTMSYDDYGNIQTIIDPVNYALTYSYDQTTSTYVTGIIDNFATPYYSSASYNPLYGQMQTSVDLNMNMEARGYDEFGRLICVYGPYDTVPVDPNSCSGSPTITFAYTAPLVASDNDLNAPVHAVTVNKAISAKGTSPINIKTVTYADGLKRIIQTKKDADVYDVTTGQPAYGMTISGLVAFDELGRVTSQGQPEFEAGFNEAFSELAATNPTYFSYDILDRTTQLLTPDDKGDTDSARPGKFAKITTTYTFDYFNGNLYAKSVVVDPEGNHVMGANFRGTKESYQDVDDRIVGVVEYNNGHLINTAYTYDPLGQITSVTDNKGNTTTVAYDQVGNRTEINNPDAGKTTYGYDANGNMTSKQNGNSQNIAYKYTFNRLTDITYPQSTTVHYDYGQMNEAFNRAARIKQVTDESGTEWRYYGRLGETIREEKMVNAHTPAVQKKKYTTDYVFDSFGRMWEMTYPDGETLHYAYDKGGLLKAAWGEKTSNRYNYVNNLYYDKFAQRVYIEYGNKTKTIYTYNDKTRRLATLDTNLKGGQYIQKLGYTYDLVGNVKTLLNNIAIPTSTALPAGPVHQEFLYDDLYQITNAEGGYTYNEHPRTSDGKTTISPNKWNNYHNDFTYDTIGNMTQKVQVNQIIQPSTTALLPKKTNYVLNYAYDASKPHAVIDDGAKTYSYDPAGNMTGWQDKNSGQKRTIKWNEENRVKEIDDNGKATYFLYDDAGERVAKRGQYGETIYINRFYAIKNGELGTKHVFAGETRVLSKVVKTPPTTTANSSTTTSTTSNVTSSTTSTIPGINGLDNGRGKKLGIIKRLGDGYVSGITQPVEKDEFYYHTDHLGSSNMITDAYGDVYQHLENFPYGESWIEEGGSHGGNLPGYKFTGKELDPETNLYYYGARYYDPVLSKWISADPILGKYLNGKGENSIYQPEVLALFSYAHLNPIKLIDPDGNEPNNAQAITWQQARQIIISNSRTTGKTITLQNLLYLQGARGGKKVGPFGGDRGGRYVWTAKRGWMDLGHFFQVAGKAQEKLGSAGRLTAKWTYQGRAAFEAGLFAMTSYAENKDKGTASYNSYEDRPSNRAGADFFLGYYEGGRGKELLKNLDKFFEDAGAGRPQDAANWKKMQASPRTKQWFEQNDSYTPMLNPRRMNPPVYPPDKGGQ